MSGFLALRGPNGTTTARGTADGAVVVDVQGTSLSLGGFTLPAYDNFTVSTSDANNNPTQVLLKIGSTLVGTLNLTYNANNSVISGSIVLP